jgi:TatD DNase family protein
MSLIDTHCHLSHEQFEGDLEGLLGRAAAAGVPRVISIASHLSDARVLLGIADGVRVFRTAGIHPHHAGALGAATVSEGMAELRALLADPGAGGAVAVGECGLDYHYDFSPRPEQRRWFEAQLALAGEVGLPVVVHCRSAEADMIPLVRDAGVSGVRGVLHCFSGDLALLDVALEAGWSVSFTGNVTFRNFDAGEAVQRVPGDRYFLETDGPYMAPVPHRGKRNEPSFLPRVRDRVAEIRGVSALVVEEETTRNAEAFFGLPDS